MSGCRCQKPQQARGATCRTPSTTKENVPIRRVRSYPPHLLELARLGRTSAEQAVVFNFSADVCAVRSPLEEVAGIPHAIAPAFERAVVDSAPLAKACALDRTLRGATRELCAAAYMLALHDLLAAFVAHGVALGALAVSCDSCGARINVQWDGAGWRAGVEGATASVELNGDRSTGRLASLRVLAEEAEFGPDMLCIEQIDASYQCPNCGGGKTVVGLAAATLRKRAPLARLEGWEP